jgi:RNA polymerase sigma-70 factor (ECF subfamily)
MIQRSNRSQDRFATTRWSVVMHAAASSSTDARTALAELVQRYWFPIYAYVRRCGHSVPIAGEVSASFMRHLTRAFGSPQPVMPRSDFRRYLLVQLNAFLGTDWRESVADEVSGELRIPQNLEQRYQNETADASSPEAAYQRAFALEIIARALRRLRSEAQRAGHLEMYTALEVYLAKDPGPGEYDALAQRLNSRPLALVVALKRLRQRFRELVGEELADTVSSAEELSTEQALLHAVLMQAD